MTLLSLMNLARHALRDQLAVVQHDQAVGNREHDLHQVLDHDDGHAQARDLADHAERFGNLGRVEAGIDLVEHEQAGFHGEALGKLQALAPRERQRCRRPVRQIGRGR